MLLLVAPDLQLTVVDRGKEGTEYRVTGNGPAFSVTHRYARVFSGVSGDGTLWIVHGEVPQVYVRAVNPRLGIRTTSVLLKLNPNGWWPRGKIGAEPMPLPPPSPAHLGSARPLTPGKDALSGYSGALSIPHEDGTTSQVFLVRSPDATRHIFVAGYPLKPGEPGPFDRFAQHPTIKARMLVANSPLYFQITMPGTRATLHSAHVASRVVGRKGEPLLYAIDPMAMNPRAMVPKVQGDGGEYQSVGGSLSSAVERIRGVNFADVPPKTIWP